MDLKQKAHRLPVAPGVYLFKNAEDTVIYVGKAKDLRARARTYFLAGQWENAKTGSLLREAADLEAILVDNEAEALALENSLIKRWQPRYNILLRDDKTYPMIRLSRETYPRVYVTRRVIDDGSEYFGPYFPTAFAYRLVHFIHKYFLVPSCRIDLERQHPRPCLQFHIHRCLGPCVQGLTTPERYGRAVEHVRLLLSGKQAELARELRQRRDAAAEAENFEEAASIRDLLTVLDDMRERQKMHAVEGEDADIIGLHGEDGRVALNVFHVRHGRVVDRREFFWEAREPEHGSWGVPTAETGVESNEQLGTLLKQIYLDQPFLPPLILVPADFEDRPALEALLSRQRESVVEIAIPQRGPKKAMLELAQKNARHSFQRRFRSSPSDDEANEAAALAAALRLPVPPRRIESFDISHFQGSETVAAMVAWQPGGMRRSDYRKFKVRTVEGVDDFAAMREVVGRRYRRELEAGRLPPDLVLIDGGIGQLHAAQQALAELGLSAQTGGWEGTLAAIAKREELIYVAGAEAAPVRLPPEHPAQRLIQRIRDETHRFAITFHRQRRGQTTMHSALLDVAGVGPVRARKLLRTFGSLRAVREADAAALAAVIGPVAAQRLAAALAAAGPPATETAG